jgi:DNA-binding response OmpR family regulator
MAGEGDRDNMKKILVVSTASTLYERMEKWLTKFDYQILFSADMGDKLKSIVERIVPDLIAIDSGVAAFSGIKLGLRIRQWVSVPLLVLSTINTEFNQIRLLDLKSTDCLSEPYDMSIVAVRIDRILSEGFS